MPAVVASIPGQDWAVLARVWRLKLETDPLQINVVVSLSRAVQLTGRKPRKKLVGADRGTGELAWHTPRIGEGKYSAVFEKTCRQVHQPQVDRPLGKVEAAPQ